MIDKFHVCVIKNVTEWTRPNNMMRFAFVNFINCQIYLREMSTPTSKIYEFPEKPK